VFLDYTHFGEAPQSFAGNSGALTFTLSGLSKISALPQMKAAWLAVSGPADLAGEAMSRLEVIADTYLSPNAPVQHALAVLLEQRHSIQLQLRQRLLQNLGELDRQLARHSSCERLQVEAGWCAVLRVPATAGDEELALDLLRRCHVLVHPGHFYDFPRDGYLVLSLIAVPEVFTEGVRRILGLLPG
jgi:alanine-synthesizing transaminase